VLVVGGDAQDVHPGHPAAAPVPAHEDFTGCELHSASLEIRKRRVSGL
jgi:hypothetical protein